MTHSDFHVTPACAVLRSGSGDNAESLAARLKLPLIESLETTPAFYLAYGSHGLALGSTRLERLKPIYVDFVGGKAAYRRNQAELIVKATAVAKKPGARVIDATAGMGGDAFILALHGARVTMLERNPVIAALLTDGLERAAADPSTAEIAARMRLEQQDSIAWIAEQGSDNDCIYLDPMFPARNKTAAVKKEMQLFQSLLQPNSDDDGLLRSALASGCHRSVVKRPAKSDHLESRKPSHSITGRSTRFDVYLQIGPHVVSQSV